MLEAGTMYCTSAIARELPLDLQQLLWRMIFNAEREKKLDYLQIFHIEQDKCCNLLVHIKHSQEKPKFELESFNFTFFPLQLSSTKIYVIDDGDHSTMLFSHEY